MDEQKYTTQPRKPEPAQPAGPVKVRRVGTFSLGVMLVVIGVLLVARMIFPALNVSLIFRFAPAVLIVLGIEVLCYAARPDVRLKYDGVSIFLILVMTLACGTSSFVARIWDNYDSYMVRQMTLEKQVAQVLDTIPEAHSTVRDFNVYTDSSTMDELLADSQSVATLYLTMNRGAQSSAEEFAADCKAVMDACRSQGLDIWKYRFDVWQSYDSFDEAVVPVWDLEVNSWSAGADVETLAGLVETRYNYDGAVYDSLEEAQRELYRSVFDSDPDEDYRNETGTSPDARQRQEFMTGRLAQAGVVMTAETASGSL